MVTLRAVLFDADGVIQHSSGDDLHSRLQASLGFVPASLDGFVREVFDAERLAVSGRADFAEQLEPVVARWGATGSAARLAAAWWCSIEVDHAILELVGRLRQRGICCALATNQQSYRAKYMRETLEYDRCFDRSFYSCELGHVKPELAYFEAVVARLFLSPEEVLFIDDREDNVVGARRAGLRAEQFVHPRSAAAVPLLTELLERFGVAAR